MNSVAVAMLMLAGCSGECKRDDCGNCCRPEYSCRAVWYNFWCNIAKPCDCRQTLDYWPLEYPGARARGWQAHGVAASKHDPIGMPVGEHIEYSVEDWHEVGTPIPTGSKPTPAKR